MKIFAYFFVSILSLISYSLLAQTVNIVALDEHKKPIANATVELRKQDGKQLIKASITSEKGQANFQIENEIKYIVIVMALGYSTQETTVFESTTNKKPIVITLKEEAKNLQEVNVVSKRPLIQRLQGKTIVNVDAAITNAGTNVLEVLEKSPGVMVDRNGGISLQGKTSVLVMIDDKPTYLSGAELNNLLTSMSSSQVNQIELITSPSAKYDASGNAGIINIKTKKNKQEGFNGNFVTSIGHGKYLKTNNNIVLNYRKGSFNTFLNYGFNYNKGFTSIYADRKYFNAVGEVIARLDQPSFLGSIGNNNNFKTGVDFYASEKTTFGLTLTGTLVNRVGKGDAVATWLGPTNAIDSAISTYSSSDFQLKNGAINVYGRHRINKKQDVGFDVDYLKYNIANDQNFNNVRTGSVSYNQGSKGLIPSKLDIFAAKIDYTAQLGNSFKFEAGLKSSVINTDNTANYTLFNGSTWLPDLAKSNRFLYKENINSVYTSLEQKLKKISYQVGLRYENTHYNAKQMGNALQEGSKFTKTYNNLFPSGFVSYDADSLNTFSFTAGRRIDRPAYQKLNPFVFIINKYTYQRGNPSFLPQYTYNFELSHSYKQLLTTTVSYSGIKNYFSQLFLSEGNDILVYTEGNVGQMHNIGASLSLQVSPFKWWSLIAQTNFNYKRLSGYQEVDYKSSIIQLHTSLNNQFKIYKALNGEISGFYTTKNRNDLQELLSPTGQLSAGVAKTILNGKGTLRLTARDIFYTQSMEGVTDFPDASEYFILWRDTQVLNVGFSYRFGKPLKAPKRSTGGAGDEINRAGT